MTPVNISRKSWHLRVIRIYFENCIPSTICTYAITLLFSILFLTASLMILAIFCVLFAIDVYSALYVDTRWIHHGHWHPETGSTVIGNIVLGAAIIWSLGIAYIYFLHSQLMARWDAKRMAKVRASWGDKMDTKILLPEEPSHPSAISIMYQALIQKVCRKIQITE